MRVAGKLARECLDAGARACGVGVTTDEIDRIVHESELVLRTVQLWNL